MSKKISANLVCFLPDGTETSFKRDSVKEIVSSGNGNYSLIGKNGETLAENCTIKSVRKKRS